MSNEIIIGKDLTKEEKYKQLLPQIRSLIEGEKNLTTNLAQICAALKYSMHGFFWIGFYFIQGDELILGPFQGPVACSRIKIPQGLPAGASAQAGVCGACVQRKEPIIVPDVDKFPGHIACSSLSRSEIVIPLIKEGIVIGVLDVDSESYDMFDEIDRKYLEEVCSVINLQPE